MRAYNLHLSEEVCKYIKEYCEIEEQIQKWLNSLSYNISMYTPGNLQRIGIVLSMKKWFFPTCKGDTCKGDRFVKMYNERIIEGSINFSLYHGAIFCPNCKERIATRYITKMDKKEAYRFVPSAFNKKKIEL